MRYFILGQFAETVDALNEWVRLVDRQAATTKLVWQDAENDEAGMLAYERLASEIESFVCAAAELFSEVVIMVDFVDPPQMNVLTESREWDNVIALLVLTFPDLNWVFGIIADQEPGSSPEAKQREIDLAAVFSEHHLRWPLDVARMPLFDPTGLRALVRAKSNGPVHLPWRKERAAAIDDERAYALFHAYTAYRFGYNSDAICSWALMKRRFQVQPIPGSGHGYTVLLEDMSLRFADKPLDIHLLSLDDRAKRPELATLNSACPICESSKYRIIVTSGYDPKVIEKNKDYLKANKVGIGKLIQKPVGGIFNLWGEICHMRARSPGQRPGNAESFEWPLEQSAVHAPSGHGAPGKLTMVAEALIRRAEKIRLQAGAMDEFIRGAVLAGDAAELVALRIPTLSLLAIALKHEFEVNAECAFVGVGYNMEVGARIREILLEVRASCESVAPEHRRSSEMNAAVLIFNRLAMIFRDQGQFDEESELMVAMRSKHRQLQLLRSENGLKWALNCVLLYAEFVVSSFGRFTSAVFLWLIGLTALWYLVDPKGSWKFAISGAWGAFFGGNAAAPAESWLVVAVAGIALVSGVFHLGVFVSYIYSQIVRK